MDTAKLAYYLHPQKLNVSPVYGAILGFILNQDFTTPQLITLSITSDGFMVSLDYFFGHVDDFKDIMNECFDDTTLSIPDNIRKEFWKIFTQRVQDWR